MSVPVVIFISVLVLLYATAPSFTRRKAKDDTELPPIDHAKVFVTAGIAAGVSFLAIASWAAVRMKKVT